MNCFVIMFVVFLNEIIKALTLDCKVDCPMAEENKMICAFEINKSSYKMFPSKCAMDSFANCYDKDFVRTPLRYCIKEHLSTRRLYGESCPVFCPSHYRPVCGASKYRDYLYRTFTNGCYLDMINCRGDDDYTGYTEVPLHFCQRHPMKNIFKEKVIMSNAYDRRDY